MSLEKLNAMHPSVKNAMREMQGLRVSLVAGASAGINAAVAEIKGEDTLITAFNHDGSQVITDRAVSTLTIADAFARGSAVFATVIATDILIVNALTYTGVAGAKSDNTEFSVDTSDEAAVIDLADSINTRDGANVVAVANGDTIEITAVLEGTGGNALTFSSPDTTITETGAGTLINGTGVKANGTLTISGPSAGETVVVDGKTYTLVAAVDAQTGRFTEFAIGGTDTLTAVNLRDAINSRVSRPDGGDNIVATNVGAVVTVTSSRFGLGGNSVGLVGDSGISASGATLTGGLIVGGFVRAATAFDQFTLTWFNKR